MHIKYMHLMALIITTVNSWAQTNEKIFYSSEYDSRGRDIYAMTGNGEVLEKVTSKLGTGHYPHFNNPKLSPDREWLVFQADADGHDRYSIWIMRVDGSHLKRVTQKEGLYPNWSPDGEEIVFSGRRNGFWEIIIISKNGGDETILSQNRAKGVRPGWGATTSFHPNGKYLVYSYIREKILYRLDLESGAIKQQSREDESITYPAYSPDGSMVAVNRKKEANYDLALLSEEGEVLEVLVSNVISYSSPAWSKDGKELLFVGSVNGSQEIFRLDLNTKKETRLTHNSSFDAMPTW